MLLTSASTSLETLVFWSNRFLCSVDIVCVLGMLWWFLSIRVDFVCISVESLSESVIAIS